VAEAARGRSAEFDAIVVAAGPTPTTDIKLVVLLQEAFRHCTTLAALAAGYRPQSCADPSKGPGVAVADDLGKALTAHLAAALGLHRALGPSHVGDGLGGSPRPLTHVDQTDVNDPSGPG
jgi:hypothetical protein